MKNFKKYISLTLILLMMLTVFTGCQQEAKEEVETPAESEVSEGPMTIEDRAGFQVTIPEDIDTIVSMAPSNTELLIELGFGDKIVAIDTQSVDIEGLPEGIPAIDLMSPDVEQLIQLDPDLIFASAMSMAGGDDPFAQLKDADIALVYIPSSDSIEGIYEDIDFIAKVLSVEEKGQDIVEDMKDQIAAIKEIGDEITEKKSVYFEIAAAPEMYSFGSGVFLNEMIDIIGARNVLADEDQWIAVSEEAILAANPDVIITNVNYIEEPVEEIKARDGWENVSAIKDEQVYYVDNMSSSLPNHNIIKALNEMAKSIYPEKY